jgi:hypothetical protein
MEMYQIDLVTVSGRIHVWQGQDSGIRALMTRKPTRVTLSSRSTTRNR